MASNYAKLCLINLFMHWLCWVFVAAHGLSLVAESGGYASLWCSGLLSERQWQPHPPVPASPPQQCGFSHCRAQALDTRASVVTAHGLNSSGSKAVDHGHELSCFTACGIFLDQGSNPCPLH